MGANDLAAQLFVLVVSAGLLAAASLHVFGSVEPATYVVSERAPP